VATGADALLLATKWNEFKQIDFTKIRKVMRQPIILDGRNIWDPELLRSLGFTYFGIGRGTQINNKQ
jgi:UDPglucose 6-dehydrogenase